MEADQDRSAQSPTYVSRGGQKLAAALRELDVDPTGWTCVDMGCNVGGFTDCLLRHGAAGVYAVDTAYGTLAWTLRQDPRVTVLERRNALRLDPVTLPGFRGCDLAVIDLGWTRQGLAIPAARRWLRPGGPGWIVSLIKPHYEADKAALGRDRGGVLSDAAGREVLERVLGDMPALGVTVAGWIASPIRGSGGKGNIEYLAKLHVTAV